MKYKVIHNANHVDESCNVCFGMFYNSSDFTIYSDENGSYWIRNNKFDPATLSYGEVDDYIFFEDTLAFGEKLYLLLKDSINKFFDDGRYLSITSFFADECAINDKIEDIKPLCKEFVSNYNIPIYPIEYADFDSLFGRISFRHLVNNALTIYILNFMCDDLLKSYEKHKKLYQSIGIERDDLPIDVYTKVLSYLDHIQGYHDIGKYRTSVIEDMYGYGFMPIKYVTNLFTFAYEILINNIATYASYSKANSNEQHKWMAHAKCYKCLATLRKEIIVSCDSTYKPQRKKRLCDKCKLENRRETVKKYEKSKRVVYDYLKINCYKSKNEELINAIENLGPKDKSTKKNLERLKRQLDSEINKNDRI